MQTPCIKIKKSNETLKRTDGPPRKNGNSRDTGNKTNKTCTNTHTKLTIHVGGGYNMA
jgi:hypothetical protein